MNDEPRRSGRATKGINPKHQQETSETGTKKSKAKGKGAKRHLDDSLSADQAEEEAIIRCICGIQDDEGGRVMICCDSCAAWQHNDCMGVTEDENDMPEQYFCEQCRPQDHKELLEAIKRGEKPWEEAARRREEARPKKKGRGGRKSKFARRSKGVDIPDDDRTGVDEEEQQEPSPRSSTTAPVAIEDGATAPVPATIEVLSDLQTEASKRKFKAEIGDEVIEQPSKLRKASTLSKDETTTTSTRRKSSTFKQQNRKSSSGLVELSPVAKSISELQNDNRKKIAIAMRGKLEKQLRDVSKKGPYRIPDGDTPSSLAEKLSVAIEHSLYQTYCREVEDFGGVYKNQFTSILFNLQANSSLLLKVLDGRLSTDELAKMSSTDMASEELQQQMASMKEEVDKQSVLVQDVTDGPRVRRTHKGEELVDDQSNQISNESIMAAPPPRRRESEMVDSGATVQSPGTVEDSKSQLTESVRISAADGLVVDTMRPVASLSSERRSSSSFDIQNVWSSVQSPSQDQSRPSLPTAARSGSRILPAHSKRSEQNDADIDRLLDEDGNESPPYSPAEFSTDTSVTWRGNIDMPITTGESVAKFKAIAHHVAGTDLAGRVSFENIFPPDLVLHGRIEDKRADKYLTSLSAARSTDVTVHSIVPVGGTDSAGPIQFDKLFNYFVSRQRYGVVGDKLHRPNVRDIYVVPLDDGFGDMPVFLQRLDYNIIEQPRPQRMLLIVFVLRWEDGVSSSHATPSQLDGQISSTKGSFQQPSQSMGAGQTPIPKADAAMSPITAAGGIDQSFQPPHQAQSVHDSTVPYGGLFPQNPYTPPYGQAMQHPAAAASGTGELAKQILGMFYSCPTAQTIITSQPDIPAESLRNLRQILEAYPATQHNITSFEQHLSQQHQLSGNIA